MTSDFEKFVDGLLIGCGGYDEQTYAESLELCDDHISRAGYVLAVKLTEGELPPVTYEYDDNGVVVTNHVDPKDVNRTR